MFKQWFCDGSLTKRKRTSERKLLLLTVTTVSVETLSHTRITKQQTQRMISLDVEATKI